MKMKTLDGYEMSDSAKTAVKVDMVVSLVLKSEKHQSYVYL